MRIGVLYLRISNVTKMFLISACDSPNFVLISNFIFVYFLTNNVNIINTVLTLNGLGYVVDSVFLYTGLSGLHWPLISQLIQLAFQRIMFHTKV